MNDPPRAARDVAPGTSWAFTDHRSIAELSARMPRQQPGQLELFPRRRDAWIGETLASLHDHEQHLSKMVEGVTTPRAREILTTCLEDLRAEIARRTQAPSDTEA